MNLDFTLLEEKQIFNNYQISDADQLEILRKYGTKCAITDYAILKGGFVASGCFVNDEKSLKNRTGYWWSKTSCVEGARAVNYFGYSICNNVTNRYGGARPTLPYSLIQSITTNEVREANNILTSEFAWYPQTIVSKSISDELEQLYKTNDLKEYQCESYNFYKYNGKRYTRVIADESAIGEQLSDGTVIKSGKYYWIEVEPIKLLIDENEDIALFEKIVFSGVPFQKTGKYKGDFEDTTIGKYLKETFSKDIEASLNFPDDLTQKTKNNFRNKGLLLEQKQILKEIQDQRRYLENLENNQLKLIHLLENQK